MKTLIVGAEDVRRVARALTLDRLMDETIERLETALRDYDPKLVEVPSRGGFSYESPVVGLVEWMPLLQVGSRVTIKLVGYHPSNPERFGVPTILSTIGLFDTHTGHLIGLVDGTLLTALRTGAASAIASKVLAKPGSSTLGLIGCGAQAVTQLHAVTRVLPIEEVLVHDRCSDTEAGFAERIESFAERAPRIRIAPVDEIVASVDVLCTQTSVGVGDGHVFEDGQTRPWLHVNAVGSDFRGKYELPRSFLLRSFVCPDHRPQAEIEGECQQLVGGHAAHIGPALAEVVQDADIHARQRERLTVFDSTGFALEDHAAVGLILDHAQALGFGYELELQGVPTDPLNPYDFNGM